MPRCIIKGCTVEKAKFNLPGVRTNCVCRNHANKSMIDVYVKRCSEEECKKQASYNFKGETKKLYCAKHRKENMFDTSHKYCEHKDCNKQPSFNYENEKKLRFCSTHKLENMVFVRKQKLCEHEGCEVIAYFNKEGEASARFCSSHKEKNMVSIRNSGVCIEEGCRKFAAYNHPQYSKALYCQVHKQNGMEVVKNKKCIFEGCNVNAGYNYQNEKGSLYCGQHRLDNMIYKRTTYCLSEHCMTQIHHNAKYRGYCFRCFIYTFPDEPVSYNFKVKEQHVVDYIKEQFSDIELTLDKTIQGGCSKKRPDIFIDRYTHSVIVEIDEDQHSDYSCENKRMMELFEDLGNRPIVFIRFNPDAYSNKDGELVKSCFNYHKTTGAPYVGDKDDFNHRLTTLDNTMRTQIDNIPEKEVTIVNLFYNTNNDVL
jgi:EsV-1-7 cysteine-rich motif